VNRGLQQNNYSPMGQGQQSQSGKKKNFMDNVMGENEVRLPEAVAPGIPAAQMGSSLNIGQNPNASNTMPINGSNNNPTNNPPNSSPYHPTTNSVPGTYGGQIFTGVNPVHAYEGFDFNREQNTGKSAKDAFAYLSNKAPAPPINDKAALGQWFDQYIRQGMNDLGHNVTDGGGDGFRFNNWQGDYWVDFARGAGAPGGALAWQATYANQGDVPKSAPANDLYSKYQNMLTVAPQNENSQLEELLSLLMSQGQI
jgi:hypothetical protein